MHERPTQYFFNWFNFCLIYCCLIAFKFIYCDCISRYCLLKNIFHQNVRIILRTLFLFTIYNRTGIAKKKVVSTFTDSNEDEFLLQPIDGAASQSYDWTYSRIEGIYVYQFHFQDIWLVLWFNQLNWKIYLHAQFYPNKLKYV